MAKIISVHPDNPQNRRIEEVKQALQGGAVMLYPTDTVYAIGCDLNSKSAVERVRKIKRLANEKPLTFLCPSLSNVATYGFVKDYAYKVMKRLIPGPYTFLLPATKLVPRLVQSPKRKTTGIRVPNHQFCAALLEALENPIISTSARLPPDIWEEDSEYGDEDDQEISNITQIELFDGLDAIVDLIIDTGEEPRTQVSTILDLTVEPAKMIRRGLGWEEAEIWL